MHITFYFVRHGETEFNRRGRLQGVCDSPLSRNGVRQAAAAAEALSEVYFDRAFTSPSERAMDTAEAILRGREIKAVIEEDLHEFDFGSLEGTRFTSHPDEIRRYYENRDFSGVDGETKGRMENRVREVFRKIIHQCEDNDRVLIASHGMFESFVMYALIGDTERTYEKQCEENNRDAYPNGSIMIFTYDDGEYRLAAKPAEPMDFKDYIQPKHVSFYYVRHGETLFNRWNRMQGSSDSPLTAAGIAQAEAARDALKRIPFTAVYASPSGRTRRTAEIIAGPHGLDVILEKGLKEVNFGDFEAVVRDSWVKEINERHMEERWDDIGGESMADINERISRTLKTIAAKAKDGDRVLLVSHGTYYLNLLHHIFGIDRDAYFEQRRRQGRQGMPNGGIFTFDYDNGRFRIRDFMVSPEDFRD